MSLPYTGPTLNFRRQRAGDGKWVVKYEVYEIAKFDTASEAAVFARDLRKAMRRGVSSGGLSVYGFNNAIQHWLTFAQLGLPHMSPPAVVLP